MESLGKMWKTEAQERFPKKFLIIVIEKRSEYQEPYGDVIGFDTEDEWMEHRLQHKEPRGLSFYGATLRDWVEKQGGIYFGKVPVDTL